MQYIACNCNIIAFSNDGKLSYLDHSKQVLAKNGCKLTNPRLIVVKLIESSNVPQNAYDIAKKSFSANKKIDVVSIYRTLALLKKVNLIHETSEGKFIACQQFDCADKLHCHHQFICTSCNKISEIHLNDKSFISKIKKMFPKLSINSHNFQFEGLCEKCK